MASSRRVLNRVIANLYDKVEEDTDIDGATYTGFEPNSRQPSIIRGKVKYRYRQMAANSGNKLYDQYVAAANAGKLLDVSNLQPNGTGARSIYAPQGATTKHRVEGLILASNNRQAFELALQLLGGEFLQYANRYPANIEGQRATYNNQGLVQAPARSPRQGQAQGTRARSPRQPATAQPAMQQGMQQQQPARGGQQAARSPRRARSPAPTVKGHKLPVATPAETANICILPLSPRTRREQTSQLLINLPVEELNRTYGTQLTDSRSMEQRMMSQNGSRSSNGSRSNMSNGRSQSRSPSQSRARTPSQSRSPSQGRNGNGNGSYGRR